MLVQTLGNTVLVPNEEVKPLVVPTGEPPAAGALSSGVAAASAGSGASAVKPFLGLTLETAEGIKNILFLSIIVFVAYKYGKGVLK